MHAGTAAIRLGAGKVSVAAHRGAWPLAPEQVGVLVVTGLMLDAAVATDQAVITVAASVGLVLNSAVASDQTVITIAAPIGLPRPKTVISVVGVVVVSVPVVVVAVSVDDRPVDIGVVVVVDVSAPATPTPVTSPCTEAPGRAAADKATAAECCTNRYACAKGNAGSNDDRRRVRRHKEGRPEDDRRIILRDINDVRVGWFNDDRLRTLLHYLDLRRGLQSARGLRPSAHYLHGSHHI